MHSKHTLCWLTQATSNTSEWELVATSNLNANRTCTACNGLTFWSGSKHNLQRQNSRGSGFHQNRVQRFYLCSFLDPSQYFSCLNPGFRSYIAIVWVQAFIEKRLEQDGKHTRFHKVSGLHSQKLHIQTEEFPDSKALHPQTSRLSCKTWTRGWSCWSGTRPAVVFSKIANTFANTPVNSLSYGILSLTSGPLINKQNWGFVFFFKLNEY